MLGHLRFALEGIRSEAEQYFIERNVDGRPFDRDTRQGEGKGATAVVPRSHQYRGGTSQK
ncbi:MULTISPECIES: hypothetical protein [Kitasatospora]|uniref:hypothetical protein n=1 Tax=Kitasatospora TaxID=2063 RepID=UPI0004C0EE22|nr:MULTISPECIES: hypothetical protein [Kitasatospora]